MSAKAKKKSTTTKESRWNSSGHAAAALAHETADRYFAGLTADLPYDTPPGDVVLLRAALRIADLIRKEQRRQGLHLEGQHTEDAAVRAGYLLGVAIGRQIGGRS